MSKDKKAKGKTIRMIQGAAGPDYTYPADSVQHGVDPEIAAGLVKAKSAEYVDKETADKAAPESAAKDVKGKETGKK